MNTKKVKRKNQNRLARFSIILLSFIVIILFGAFLLWLPISHSDKEISFIDSLFISTSAVCVTGLSPYASIAEHLSMFGRVVLSILIEIGGLGIVSLVMFIAVIFGFKITFNQRSLLKEALNQDNVGGIVHMLKRIVITALSIQFFGAILNFISLFWIENFPLDQAIGYSIFHAISSFNNAGFDLFGSSSLINYSDNILFNISTCLMIFCGGIGFIVIFDILQKRKFRRLSLHSKIVLVMSLSMLVFSTLIFKLLNYNSITWLEAGFLSFTLRTAGFTTINLSTLNDTSLIISMLLMFIGASPCSTAGGIKVTTVFAMLISFRTFATEADETHAFKRKIPENQITKAFVLSTLAFAFVCLSTIIMSAIEQGNFTFKAILFEIVSGFGTVGLTLGITPSLSIASKLLMCLVMYVGRLGPITFISLFHKNEKIIDKDTVRYVEESIIIG